MANSKFGMAADSCGGITVVADLVIGKARVGCHDFESCIVDTKVSDLASFVPVDAGELLVGVVG